MDIELETLVNFYNSWLTTNGLPEKDAYELLADFNFGEFDDTHKDTAYYTSWITGFITMWEATEKFLQKRG